MSENKKDESAGKTNLSRPGRLEMKKIVDAGRVRQSFSPWSFALGCR